MEYLPFKLSVTEDGLSSEIGLTKKFYSEIGSISHKNNLDIYSRQLRHRQENAMQVFSFLTMP